MEEEEFKRVQFQYGIVLLRTKRFQPLMDRLGKNRISKPAGWALLYLMPIAAGIGLFVFLTNIAVFLAPPAVQHQVGTVVRSVSPLAYIGLPGINPYLPIVDGWIALIVAIIIHEGAHGIVARSLGLPVKNSGLLFFLIFPIGAFVEVDETALKEVRARDSGRVLAAGAGVNFVVGVLALLLLFSVVATMVPAADGVGVTQVDQGSPADKAGIHPGDIILTINGIHYDDPSTIAQASWYLPGEVVNMTLWRGGQVLTLQNITLAPNPNNSSIGFVGVGDIGYSSLKETVSTYTGSFFSRPLLYLCIPTFPRCESVAPFSDQLSVFYTSPFGGSLIPITGLLYWFFFLNFNLAVFNALPIYPLDGGQAFRAGLKGLTKGRLSEVTLSRVSVAATVAILVVVVSLPLAAYLNLI